MKCLAASRVHDNLVCAQTVDYDEGRIVLHTVYWGNEPPEYTDIVFTGVVAFHVQEQVFRGHGVGVNILFDVVEADPAFILGRYADLLASTKNYVWPVLQ